MKTISQWPFLKRTASKKKNLLVVKDIYCLASTLNSKGKNYKVARLRQNKSSVKPYQQDKEKHLSHIVLTVVVMILNSLNFESRVLTLIKKPERSVYRYINTDAKKSTWFLLETFKSFSSSRTWHGQVMNLFIPLGKTRQETYPVNFKGTLMQIWKSANIFAFIWK